MDAKDRGFAGEVGLGLAAKAAAQQQVVHGDLSIGTSSVSTDQWDGSARAAPDLAGLGRDTGGRRGRLHRRLGGYGG